MVAPFVIHTSDASSAHYKKTHLFLINFDYDL